MILDDTSAKQSTFGLAFEGKQYAMVKADTTESFNLVNPSHLNMWLYIIDDTSEQYIFCKHYVRKIEKQNYLQTNSVYVPGICLLIKNQNYYVRIKEQQLNMSLPVLTGWNFISIYFSGNDATSTTSINRVQMMNFNNRVRQISPYKTFSTKYHDDRYSFTLFGARQYGVNIIDKFFIGYIYDISLYSSQTPGEAYPISTIETTFISYSCSGLCKICSPLKSTCLEYDPTDTSLMTHAWDLRKRYKTTLDFSTLKNFAGYVDFLTSLFFQDVQIIADQGAGNVKIGGSQAYTFGTANHGVYFNQTGYMMSFDALRSYRDKAFTVEVFFRTDKGIYTKTYIFETLYLSMYFDADLSFKVNLNGTTKSWSSAFNNTLDIKEYIFVGVSLIKSSTTNTTVCVYIKTNNETSMCKIFDKIYQTSSTDDGQEYRIGKFGRGLNGVLVTAYIWNFAKALNTMKLSAVPKDQCNPSTNAPKPFCLSCDYYLADQTCFDSCNFTNIGGYPCQNSIYNCPNLCLTCEKVTQCTYCQDDSRMSTFDCVCRYGYFEQTNATTGKPYCTMGTLKQLRILLIIDQYRLMEQEHV
eukprot:403333755